MKLHLGCGKKRWDGFLNVDLKGSEFDCDIRSLPFENETAEEIHAIHVCEHFYIHEIAAVLTDWKRVLKPQGRLIVELPCWDKVQRHIEAGSPDNFVRWALYGEPRTHQDGEPALHKWCYSLAEFQGLLEHIGFARVVAEVPIYHQPTRDMRFVAIK